MLGAGRLQCWNYVKNKYPQRQISDIEGYLAKSNMGYEYTWGTDCEIMTAAYMFGIDIFVAIDDSRRNTKIIGINTHILLILTSHQQDQLFILKTTTTISSQLWS